MQHQQIPFRSSFLHILGLFKLHNIIQFESVLNTVDAYTAIRTIYVLFVYVRQVCICLFVVQNLFRIFYFKKIFAQEKIS